MYRSDDIENYYINGNNNDIYKFIKSSIYIWMVFRMIMIILYIYLARSSKVSNYTTESKKQNTAP